MSEIISRRDFLKCAGLVYIVLLDRCVPEYVMPSKILSTPTEFVPTYTSEPEPTKIQFSIKPEEWAVNEKASIFAVNKELVLLSLEDLLYPYVGDWILTTPQGQQLASSKNRAIDLLYDGLKLVVVVSDDLSQPGFDRDGYRRNLADQLNTQDQLKVNLSDIKQKLIGKGIRPEQAVLIINGPDYSPANPIPTPVSGASEANAKITGIAVNETINYYEVVSWYRIDKNNGRDLVRLTKEEEPVLLPPLQIKDGRFIRTDSGREVMMRGTGFDTSLSTSKLDVRLKKFKAAGGNFISIGLDKAYLDKNDPAYYLSLSQALELAKNRYGIRIMLSIGWDTGQPGSDKMIRSVDNNLVKYWNTLLNYQNKTNPFFNGGNFASVLKRTVDVFDMLTEPNGDYSIFDKDYDSTGILIRQMLGNPNAILGRSNGKWFATSDVELIGRESEWVNNHPQETAVIHAYLLDNRFYEPQGTDIFHQERPDPLDYILGLQAKGVLTTIGETGVASRELGLDDWLINPEWLMKLYRTCEENKIPYITDDYSKLLSLWQEYKENIE